MNTKEFYNSEIKEKYLKSFENSDTRNVKMYLMKRATKTEKDLGKDIYDMTLDELGNTLLNMSCASNTSAYNSTIFLEEYIIWSFDNGYRRSNIIPFDGVDKIEWSKKFVATYRQIFFTREQIEDMVDELVNYSDKALLLSLFEGISGSWNSEILNLRVEDLTHEEGTNYIKLHDDKKGSRTISISSMLALFLEKANNETAYLGKNGEATGKQNREIPYEESPMIFKKLKRGTQGGSLDNTHINRKLEIFKDVFGSRFLNRRQIINSGMMHMAHELYQMNGRFEREHLDMIAEQFNTSSSIRDGKLYWNPSIVRKVVSTDEFEQLYGYKLEDK